jgi:Ca-activated chloride channel homolog
VESVDSAGNERDGLITSVSVTNTAGSSFSVPFVQGSPGVYSGVAKGLDEGVYQVQITQRSPETGNLVAQQTTGFVVPYPAEYRLVDNAEATARQLTSDLAQLGGGQVLSMQSTADVWRHDIVAQPMKIPLWPWLILAAILLFPVDVAVRRLSVTWSELLGRTREPRHSV